MVNRAHPLCPSRAWLPRCVEASSQLAGSVVVPELVAGSPPATFPSYAGAERRKGGWSPRFGPGVEWVTGNNDGVYGMDCGDETNLLTTNGLLTLMFGKFRGTSVAGTTKGNTFGPFDTGSPYTVRCGANVPYTDGNVYWDYGGVTAGTSRLAASGLSFGDDVWAFTVGARGMEIWQNQIKRASNAGTPTRVDSGGNFYINAANDTSGFTRVDSCTITFFYIYQRQLTEAEIVTVMGDPFQWLEMPRRVGRSPAAAGGLNLNAHYYAMQRRAR